jgi:hypothetical protein
MNAKNLDALDELLVPDGVDHTCGSENAEQANQFFGMVHQAFPDLHAEVYHVITEGSRWLLGDLYRHPPGRVRRHPRDPEADDHQRGRSVRDAKSGLESGGAPTASGPPGAAKVWSGVRVRRSTGAGRARGESLSVR